jgi:muramoyltetrapeptide carboxypeptidase
MLTQLRNAGVLRSIGGLILGAFTKCSPSDPSQPFLDQAAIFNDAIGWFSQPAVDGFAFGHVPAKLTIPLGCLARLDADRGRLELLEPAVS